MAEFLQGDKLNSEISNLIRSANKFIFIVSPYIKLHARIKDEFLNLKGNPEVAVRILFGKNIGEIEKSFKLEDIEFFKQFPNIEIRFENRLHAKYYTNEKAGILTSMNLYDFSQNNNIEAGVLAKGDKFEKEAFEYFNNIFLQSTLKFKNQPIYKDKLFGLSKVYSHSDVKYDKISTLIEVEEDKGGRHVNGFCIRTGVNIPFDISNPYSKEAYKSWSQFKNETYPEKFCHYSGEKSNGETCFKTPVLRKYYAEAKRGLGRANENN